jgi:hypothetical protein
MRNDNTDVQARLAAVEAQNAAIEVQMEMLMGNGQPGKIAAIEAKLDAMKEQSITDAAAIKEQVGKLRLWFILGAIGAALGLRSPELFKLIMGMP